MLRDVLLTLAAVLVGMAVALVALFFIEFCANHELRMSKQRSSEREAGGLVGEGHGGIHSSEVIHVAE